MGRMVNRMSLFGKIQVRYDTIVSIQNFELFKFLSLSTVKLPTFPTFNYFLRISAESMDLGRITKRLGKITKSF
jgi:hypothetical protein